MPFRILLWLLLVVAIGIFILLPEPMSHRTRINAAEAAGDWQQACEATDAEVFTPKLPMELPAPLWSVPVLEKPYAVLSLEWDQDRRGAVVLSGEKARVEWLARDGSTNSHVGRYGEGPGDLSFPPIFIGTREKLALLGTEYIVVVDGRRVSAFTKSDRFLGDFIPDSSVTGMNADVQVQALGESSVIVSRSGRWHPERSWGDRVKLELLAIELDRRGFRSPRVLGTLSNPLASMKPFNGLAPRAPYAMLHRRTWGVSATTIYALSYSAFGFCRITVEGKVIGHSRVAAPPRPVDDTEQERELSALHGSQVDDINPMLGATPRDYLDGTWPSHAPFYYDLLVSPTGEAIAVRLAPEGAVLADLFGASGDYVQTYLLPANVRPYRLRGTSLLALDVDHGVLKGFDLTGTSDSVLEWYE